MITICELQIADLNPVLITRFQKKNLEWEDPVQGMIGLSGSWTIKKGNF